MDTVDESRYSKCVRSTVLPKYPKRIIRAIVPNRPIAGTLYRPNKQHLVHLIAIWKSLASGVAHILVFGKVSAHNGQTLTPMG